MLDAVLGYILNKVADESYTELLKELSASIDATQQVKERLGEIDEKMDMQMLAPLRAGLTFLRLGAIDRAIEELVMATSVDPDSAVSNFWLGMLLQSTGRPKGREFLEASLTLNPHVAFRVFPDALPRFRSSSIYQYDPTWELEIGSRDYFKRLPCRNVLRTLIQKLNPLSVQTGSSAVRAISTGSGNIVVGWIYSDNLRGSWSVMSAVSSLTVVDGSVVWHTASRDSQLLFASPTFVAIEDKQDKLHSYKLLDAKTGKQRRAMSKSYFELSFAGGSVRNLLERNPYESRGLDIQTIDDRSCVVRTDVSPKDVEAGREYNHRPHEWIENISAVFPDGSSVEAHNWWNHWHTTGPPWAEDKECRLISNVYLKYFKH